MSLLPPQQYTYVAHPRHPPQNRAYEIDPYPASNYDNPLVNNYHLGPHSYASSPYIRKNYHHPRQMSGPPLSPGGHPVHQPSAFKTASKYILPPGPYYDHPPPMYHGGPDPGYSYRRSMDARYPYGGGMPYGGGYYPAYTEFDDGGYGDYYGGGRAQSGGVYGGQDHEKAIDEISKIRDLRRAFEDLKAPQDLLHKLQGFRNTQIKGKQSRKNKRYEKSLESSYETAYEESFETERTEQTHPQIAYVQNYPVVPVNYNGGYALAIVPPEQLYQLEANQMQQVNMPVPAENTGQKTFRPPEKYVPPPKEEQKSVLQAPQRGRDRIKTDMSLDNELDKKGEDFSKSTDMVIFGNDAMLNDILGNRRTERKFADPKRQTKTQQIMEMVQATGNSTYKFPPRAKARKETLEEILIRNRVDEDDMKVLRRNLKDILYKPANLKESQEILEASFEKQKTTLNGNGTQLNFTQNKTSSISKKQP